MENVRSSQRCISMNFCTEFSKAQVFSCEIMRASFQISQVPKPVVKLNNILIKSMGIGVVAKNHLQLPKAMFLPQIILKITI